MPASLFPDRLTMYELVNVSHSAGIVPAWHRALFASTLSHAKQPCLPGTAIMLAQGIIAHLTRSCPLQRMCRVVP